MTGRLSDQHLPADAVRIIPTEASVARGYIAETGTDAVFLNVYDPRQGTFTIIVTPGLAADLGHEFQQMHGTLAKLNRKEDTDE